MRMVRAAVAVLGTLTLVACQRPTVSDEVVGSVEGPHVEVVAEQVEPNPSDQWNTTFLLLEVTGPGSRLERVSSVLRENGWRIHESEALLLTADRSGGGGDRPVADLGLTELDAFLVTNRFSESANWFSEFPTQVGCTYYVAILMPLNF